MAQFCTLRVGGAADYYIACDNSNEFADVCSVVQRAAIPHFVLGGGSNICVSDSGIRGLVIHNLASSCAIGTDTVVDCGFSFMRLFQRAAQASLAGLEFAVGIPGTVGGALVSNAGAYRQNICDIVRDIRVVTDGIDRLEQPGWMQFSYRDSRLRRAGEGPAALVSVRLRLTSAPRGAILAAARENQRQRLFKQPWNPSAGSFFKNVYSAELADRVPGLSAEMRAAGVVPAGYLSAAAGCAGLTIGGAQMSARHANILINRGSATACDVMAVTGEVKKRVKLQFGVELHEEVLFVGDWSGSVAAPGH